jgi:hypothetical protein
LTGIVDIVGFRADDSGAPNEPEPKRVQLTKIKVADSNINGVAFDPTGAKIAAACDDGSVSVWDIHSQGREHYLKPEHLPGGKPDRATSVCYLTATRLAAGFASGRIVLWDVKHADRPVTLEHSHEAGVFGLDYSPGSTQRLVSGAGTSIKVWTVLGLGGPPPIAPNSPGTGDAPGNIKNPPAPPAPPAFPGIWDPLTHKGAAVGDTITRQEDGSVYVWVPAGTFKYGLDDKPTDVEGYWIARDCVTWRQYLKFCDATAYRTPDDPKFKHSMDDPVVMVSLEDAKKYASWAKAQLPTEIQWEKAARFTDGRTYPWGNTWNAGLAQVSEDVDGKAGHTSPVSAHDDGKSPFGCRDMVGNVAQWVLDSVKDPPEPVVRGIGWFDSDIPLRPCVSRVAPLASPTYRKDIGFRLAGPILK